MTARTARGGKRKGSSSRGERASLLRRGPAWARAVLAGLLMAASVPPWGWWPLGFAGMALWAEALAEPRRSLRAALSALAAAAWLAPSTVWMIDLSAPGWVCAVAGFAAMHALAGAVVPDDRRRWAAFPAAFTLAEALRWYWPFGGVPLATMAMAQVSGPLAATARLGGDLLLSGLTAVVGVTLAATAALRPKPALIGAVLIAVAGFAADQSPRSSAAAGSALQVAAVQGGGPQNTRADICETRGVFERHLQATTAQVKGDVDLIVWPEDVVHLSPPGAAAPARCRDQTPLTEAEAGTRLSDLASEKRAVLVAGFFERSPDGRSNLNYMRAYGADGSVTGEYHKHQLVPFGEYVPLRSLVERFSDELPGRDVRRGPSTVPAALDTSIGPLGVSISWEVFFGHRARSAVGDGVVLLNPTNGSSYWLTVVQSQQIAASRLRAIETGRWVVQASPTGFSAVIDPGGKVVERSGVSETRVIRAAIEPRRGDTLPVRLGVWPVVAVAVLALAQALGAGRRLTGRRPR